MIPLGKPPTVGMLARATAIAFFGNAGAFLRAAPLPLLSYYALNRLAAWVGDLPLVPLILSLASLIAVSSFAVACHRIVLLGDRTAASPSEPHLGRREFRFFGYSLLIGVVMFPLILVLAVGAQFFGLFASDGQFALSPPGMVFLLGMGLVVMIVGLRLSLALPAAAVDAPDRAFGALRRSWALTKGATMPMLFVNVLLMLAVVVIGGTLGGLLGALGLIDPSLDPAAFAAVSTVALLNAIIEFLAAALLACLFSSVYGMLGGAGRQTDEIV